MDSLTQQMIQKMQSEIDELNAELLKNPLFEQITRKKKIVNELSIDNGGNAVYPDVASDGIVKSHVVAIKPGMFLGRPLAKAVRMYLEMRGKDNPPTFDEIQEALKQGDFDFKKVGDPRTALVKNNANFKLLSGDKFGLYEWYFGKARKSRNSQDNEENDEEGSENGENGTENDNNVNKEGNE